MVVVRVGLEAVRGHFAASGLLGRRPPERLDIVDALPRAPAGKVKKFPLRRQFTGPAAGVSA